MFHQWYTPHRLKSGYRLLDSELKGFECDPQCPRSPCIANGLREGAAFLLAPLITLLFPYVYHRSTHPFVVNDHSILPVGLVIKACQGYQCH